MLCEMFIHEYTPELCTFNLASCFIDHAYDGNVLEWAKIIEIVFIYNGCIGYVI